MDKLTFIAFLYVIGICGIVAGGIGLYVNYDYSFNYQDAVMKLAAPSKYGFDAIQDDEVIMVDVVYEISSEKIPVHGKIVQGKYAKLMQAGNKIPVRFCKDDLDKDELERLVYINGRKPDSVFSNLSWLALGVVMLSAAIYAHRLWRKEGCRL